jgi:peptidoglycan DL-endopeptidase CwlO
VFVLRTSTFRRPLTILVSLLLAGTLVVPAAAQPSSAELRSQLQRAEDRLQEIQMELAEAVEDYNEAAVALETSEAALFVTQQEHTAVSTEVATLSVAAEDHIRRIHKLGPGLELSAVLVAGNPSDAGAKAATLRRVLTSQRSDLETLAAARTSVAAMETRLDEQRAAAAAHAEELAAQRDAVEAMIEARQGEITQLEGEVRAAEQREEEERRREEERLRREAEERARQQALEDARLRAAADAQAAERAAEQRAAEQQREADRATATAPAPAPSPSAAPAPAPSPTATAAPAPAPATRRSAQVAVDTALAQVGKPYQWGGSGPNSYDCSGLTSFAWRAAGVEITRTSRSQWTATKRVSRAELQPGDLVFYSRSGPANIGHVAMFIGDGKIVEASRAGVPVRVSSTGLSRSDILGYGRP